MKLTIIGWTTLLLLSLYGCEKIAATKNASLGEHVSLTVSFKDNIDDRNHYSYVHGVLAITGRDKRLLSVDLNCIGLRLNGQDSKALGADTVASISTSDYKATNGKIDIDVHWVFSQPVYPDDLDRVEINITPTVSDGRGCATFAGG